MTIRQQSPLLSLVFPVFNEEYRLRNFNQIQMCFDAMFNERVEYIIVSNGSTDGTALVAARYASTRVTILEVPVRGRGAALRTGFLAARSPFIGVAAIDRAWNESFYQQALDLLHQTTVSVVYGPKTHAASKVRRPWIRSIASVCIRMGLGLLYGRLRPDTQCIKVFRREDIEFIPHLGDCNYFAETEFYLRAEAAGLRTYSIPVLVADQQSNSKVRIKSIFEFFEEAIAFRKIWKKLDQTGSTNLGDKPK